MTRFLIVGLPRSGTTYAATLLNSHKNVLCEGEQFNPYGIIGLGWKKTDLADLIVRDADPVGFLKQFFAAKSHKYDAVGCKWMLGHHPEIMAHITDDPELRIIYVYRANKLAQASSLQKAIRTQNWAATKSAGIDTAPIEAGPRHMAQLIREMQVQDQTFEVWLKTLSNPILRVEYSAMFTQSFTAELCNFLDVNFDPKMRSPLIKQGESDILARFSHRDSIKRYFTEVGRGDWLLPEY